MGTTRGISKPGSGGKVYWTRQRVIEGLQRFYVDFGETPVNCIVYARMIKSEVSPEHGTQRRRCYPSERSVFIHFRSMREAWEVAGLPQDRHKERWTAEEDAYILENWIKFSRKAIANKLRRTVGAVANRKMALGITERAGSGARHCDSERGLAE